MWKWIVMIFLCEIFFGASGMLKSSLRNHKAGSAACRYYHNQPEDSMADCWCGPGCREKNQVSHDDWIDCNWVFTRTTDRTEGKYNFVDVMGWRNSKKIKQRWSNSGRRLGGPLSTSVTRRMSDPECCRDCKHRRGRGTAVIQRKYRSSEVNKSIVISITDRNVYQWVTAKRWFSKHDQKRRPIRSVASDCLNEIYDTVALNVIQKQRK